MSASAAAALFVTARRAGESRSGRGFRWYGLSFALTSVGTAIWFWQESVLGVDPTYSWSNVPYLLSYPAAILGVLAFRTGGIDRVERLKLALDSAITLVAGITITGILVVIPLADATGSRFQQLLTFAYPVGDLLIFAVLVPTLLTQREPGAPGVVRWLAIGQMVYLAGDLSFQLPPTYTQRLGVDWPDLVYAVGYVLLIFAAESGRKVPEGAVGRSARAGAHPRNPLPVFLGLVVYALLLLAATRPWNPPTSALALAAVVVTVLILIREGLTERRNVRLARALESRRGDARFQRAMSQLRVGVMVQGPDTRIRLANPAAIEMLGLSRVGDEFVGPEDVVQDDGTPFPPGTRPVTRACATGRAVRNVVVGVRRRGHLERTWLMVDVEPRLEADGRVEEVISSLHDITERRMLEEQLRQAQRMEAVGRLAGGIAHDFNNLLTAIIGYTSLVQNGLEPGSPLVDDVREIEEAAQRAAALTQQLLAFSRRQLLHPELIDVNEVIRAAERMLSRLLGEDIEILTDLAPEAGLIRVDRGQLEQVIVNLAVNARDALPRGGRLGITTRVVRPGDPDCPTEGAMRAAGAVLLRVSDNGFGMEEITRSRAFEPFFTTKEIGKGTGLGLSTVYGIVQQSGGEVSIDSAPGGGTTVTVCLPRVGGALAPLPERRPRSVRRAVTKRSSSPKTSRRFAAFSTRPSSDAATGSSRHPTRPRPAKSSRTIRSRSTCSSPTS